MIDPITLGIGAKLGTIALVKIKVLAAISAIKASLAAHGISTTAVSHTVLVSATGAILSAIWKGSSRSTAIK